MTTADESEAIMVLTTCPDQDSARLLASRLLDLRLAACVQADQIESWYRWEGAVQNDPEVRLVIKTTQTCFEDIERLLAAEHPYDEPQCIAMAITTGSAGYLSWVRGSVD